MIFNDEMREAVLKAVNELGSQRVLAAETGISPQNINKYVNGKVKTIRQDAWKKLYPKIVKWLPSWPGGFPDNNVTPEAGWSGRREKIFRVRDKITLHLEDSDGISLTLELTGESFKRYNYLGNVTRTMFLSQIDATVKKLLEDVSIEDNELNP